MCVPLVPSSCTGQKRLLDSLEMELVMVSCQWVLRTKAGSSARADGALTLSQLLSPIDYFEAVFTFKLTFFFPENKLIVWGNKEQSGY